MMVSAQAVQDVQYSSSSLRRRKNLLLVRLLTTTMEGVEMIVEDVVVEVLKVE
jgi:hypothetical protein